jgi:hypothetical protein
MKLVVVDKPRTAYENLAINDACLHAVRDGLYEQIVRVYGFSRPGVILSSDEDIWDVREEARAGLDVTRRPTGGSVVYVDKDTLGYSVFLKTGSKVDITATYRTFTERVVQSLRELGVPNIAVGNWYVRCNGGVIAGHAQQNRGEVSEFQGLMRLTSWDVDDLERILRLRLLAAHNGSTYLVIDNAAYDLAGKAADVPVSSLRVIRSERDELAAAPALAAHGINSPTLMERLATGLSGVEERHALPERILEHAAELQKRYTDRAWVYRSDRPTRRGLGHCFVDLVQRESEG